MRYLILLMCLTVSSLALGNDTIRISTPVENTFVEVNQKGDVEFYVKLANSLYKTDKESYLIFRDALLKGINIDSYAITDEKRRVLKIISK